ncbi:putative NBD/HSP70 family sugar kinase [Homoserinimonas aerilata]|uniref:Putative NBD/HSP70 family sugar kinase n=1 Tax=Homoserinimonas aerilata TaxID=1162970 RepID=A0A542YJ52_9MICO|nr:ROK family transcriptional regulator [Homoserinimonas aerilata]TQL48061.1 putative NBD/HSP70 family sugar kinase [Homoserinimonas aerilata]
MSRRADVTDARTAPPSAPRTGTRTSNDQLRRFNLSMLMELLHHNGGCSRAELTRQTGLNRSTIAVLVSELVEAGLAYEGEPETVVGQIGRPSLRVHPQPRLAAITVNPEGRSIAIGLVGLGGEIIRSVRFDTAHIPTPAETVAVARSIVGGMQPEIRANYDIVGIGVAVPGLVNASNSRIVNAPQLSWHDVDLATPMADAFALPVYVANDASVGAIAENMFGAARGVRDLVFVNGGTNGIGGGVIIDGAPLRGTTGFAGELGHIMVNSNGRRCHCGRIGCLETEVNLASILEPLRLTRADEHELDIELGVTRDHAVLEEVQRQLGFLSIALTNLVNIFDPEMVVLGGYLGALLTVSEERLGGTLNLRSLSGHSRAVTLSRARLRSRRVMIGAAELAFAPLLTDPLSFRRS